MKINENIKKARKSRNMTQTQLADELHVSRSLVARWEYGDVIPNIEYLEKMSLILEVPLENLLDEKDKVEVIKKQGNKIKFWKWLAVSFVCIATCIGSISIVEKIRFSSSQQSLETQKNLDPSTMSLEDYKDINFSWIKNKKVGEKVSFNPSAVEIKNKRTPSEGECEVKVYFFENDIFIKAEYQYLILTKDYSGKGTQNFKFEYYDPYTWTGIEAQLSLIGLYSDPEFNNLIDPNSLEYITEDLKEIYVRAASDIYVYRYINDGTYTNGEYTFIISDNVATCVVNGTEYKITSINDQMESQLYVNNVLIEDKSRYDFSCNPWGLENIYRRSFFALYLDGEYIVPMNENYSNYYNTKAYSTFAYL